MSSHITKLERSPRLQAFVRFLRRRGKHGATTRELGRALESYGVANDISELRQNGLRVDSHCERVTKNGRRVYRYVLREPGAGTSANT